ncbi:MAG: helix-turn-helix transcriptional regulator [Clostridium sp.]
MSNNLVLYRKKYKVTQAEIAKVINKGNRSVSLKENGKSEFTQTEMSDITKFFKSLNKNITVEAIFFKDYMTDTVT